MIKSDFYIGRKYCRGEEMLRKRQIILDAVCIGVIVLISLPYIMNFQVPYLHTDFVQSYSESYREI